MLISNSVCSICAQWGHAPLHNAAIMAHSDIVQLLLTHPDAEINTEDHVSLFYFSYELNGTTE